MNRMRNIKNGLQILMFVPCISFVCTNVCYIRGIRGRSMEPLLNNPIEKSESRHWEHYLPYLLQQDIVFEVSASLDKLFCNLFQRDYLSKGTVITLWSPTERGQLVCKRVVGTEGDWICNRDDRSKVVLVPSDRIWIEGDNERMSKDSNEYGHVPVSLHQGTIVAVLWPPSHVKLIDHSKIPEKFRYF